MITARNVSKWFGSVAAVRGVSFSIPSGQIVGLLGPNGAGKTTTLRMITGFLPPSSGSIEVAGHDTISQALRASASIGYLPEAAPLYPEMRVVDYLRYRARLYGVGRLAGKAAIGRAMERCWLTGVARRRVGQLSKGFKQRVGLAGALLHDPKVLILDEPTSGLDPTQIRETRSLIRELAERRTVLVSSHILPEIEKTCDRVLIIAFGTLRADGTPDDLLAPLRAAAPYVAEVPAAQRPAAVDALRGVPGVGAVETAESGGRGGEWGRVVIRPAGGAGDLREAVARALSGAGVVARELGRESPTLEQLFFRIIEGEGQRGAA